MKQKIIDFFKNKFNMTLIILQTLAILCYFLNTFIFFLFLFFAFESSFLIVWGVRYIYVNKSVDKQMKVYEELPYTDAEKEMLRKNSENASKNNKMIAIMLIVFGIVLFFSGISVIF